MVAILAARLRPLVRPAAERSAGPHERQQTRADGGAQARRDLTGKPQAFRQGCASARAIRLPGPCRQVFSRVRRSANEMPIADSTNVK
jgi:hypothetical protein